MPDVMMMLGPFPFSVDTAAYQEIARTTEFKWKAQERLHERDALQSTGQNDKITLSGAIYPHYKGGAGQLNAMRAVGAEGLPLLLVTGIGQILGRWVIASIEERQNAFFRGGIPRRQEFSMSLLQYDDGPLPG